MKLLSVINKGCYSANTMNYGTIETREAAGKKVVVFKHCNQTTKAPNMPHGNMSFSSKNYPIEKK